MAVSSPSFPPSPAPPGRRRWEQSVAPNTLWKARAKPKEVNTFLSLGELYCFHTEMPLGEWPDEAYTTPIGTKCKGCQISLYTHLHRSKSSKKEAAEQHGDPDILRVPL